MKNILLYCSAFVLLFSQSCSGPKDSNDETQIIKALGDRNYGGIFRLNESEYIKNLFPHNITDAYSYRVASQVYEGLFKFDDESLQVIPCLAESYTVDESGTLYTIKIKENVFFHDDPCFPDGKGRELTSADVSYCFTKLCTQNINNQLFTSIFKNILKGADRYYNATENEQVPGKNLFYSW